MKIISDKRKLLLKRKKSSSKLKDYIVKMSLSWYPIISIFEEAIGDHKHDPFFQGRVHAEQVRRLSLVRGGALREHPGPQS